MSGPSTLHRSHPADSADRTDGLRSYRLSGMSAILAGRKFNSTGPRNNSWDGGPGFFIRLGTPNERDGQRDRGVRRRDVEINGHWLNSCTEAQPYQPGSPLPIRNSEVKQVRAGVVLRWGTTREGPVLRFFCISFSSRFSFLFLKPSRFSLCSPSFYVPLLLGHMHMHMHMHV
jgi:hypothetical protein